MARELLSNRAYARHRGCSETSVRKALKSGRISREENGLIDPKKADEDWAKNTLPIGKTRAMVACEPKTFAPDQVAPKKTAPDYQTSRAVREAYVARLAKLEYENKSGKLEDKAQRDAAEFTRGRIVRDRILSVPHRVAAICAAENSALKVEQLLNEELRSALSDLARGE